MKTHDAGGKVKIAVEDDVEGGAIFSSDEFKYYRHVLWRKWKGALKAGYVLWIGMNPSTAEDRIDDPTVKKERKYTKRLGYGHYVKCNVMDYRSTDQKKLVNLHVPACSEDNLKHILEQARGAALVVLAFGTPHKSLRHHGERVVNMLKGEGIPLYCLDISKSGNPKHPLYIRDDKELIKFAA